MDRKNVKLMEVSEKVCSICKQTKSINNFFRYSYSKDKLRYECKECGLKQDRSYRSKLGKDKVALRAYKSNLKNRFGITWEEYQTMAALQNMVCAICNQSSSDKRNSRLAVDHDHKTGKIRGLLCGNCNGGLGKFKDDRQFLINAINYLDKNHG